MTASRSHLKSMSQAVSGVQKSLCPPYAVVITGSPKHIASAIGKPKPSPRVGATNA